MFRITQLCVLYSVSENSSVGLSSPQASPLLILHVLQMSQQQVIYAAKISSFRKLPVARIVFILFTTVVPMPRSVLDPQLVLDMYLWNENRAVYIGEVFTEPLSWSELRIIFLYQVEGRKPRTMSLFMHLVLQIQNKHCFMIKMNYPDILSHLIRLFFIQNVVGTIT